MGMYNDDLRENLKMSGLLAEAVLTLARRGEIGEELVPLCEFEGERLLDNVVKLDRDAGRRVVAYMAMAFKRGRQVRTAQDVYRLSIDAEALALLMDWAHERGYGDAPDVLVWA